MNIEDKIKDIAKNGVEYKAGFDPGIPLDVIEKKGISEDIIRYISKKNDESEDILQFRLDAFHKWLKMKEPHWAVFNYNPIDYNDMYFFAKPKEGKVVDEKIESAYKRLGVPLKEQKILK